MMNDFEKIEHLLLSKKFEELNPSEVKEVQGYFENATDYNDMRDTLMQVKSTLAADKLLIKPNVELKEKLLQQFEKTYSNVTPKSGGKTRPFYRKMAFQWSAAASIVIIISITAVAYINNMSNKSKEMAINYDNPKKDDAPLLEEKSTAIGESTADTSAISISNPERKENSAFDQPTVGSTNVSSNTDEAEEDKGVIFGNISTKENEITEGELNNNNGPNDDLLKDNKDNTTLDTREKKSEEKRDDANYYYNDALKGKDDKKLELNTTIPVNTTVNEKRSTTTKDYWANKKQKNNNLDDGDKNAVQKEDTEKVNLGGYMSVNQMVQTEKKDSSKVKLDSLNMDSNQLNNQRRESSIDINAPKKDN